LATFFDYPELSYWMKNLIVAMAGNTSMHAVWKAGDANFDLFVAYYGDIEDRYSTDGKYYERAKGTKFHILHQLAEKHQDVFSKYDAIFVPDDDMYMETDDINRFLDIFHQHKLEIAQPSIFGWISVPITAHVPFSKLRYVNWVEIMCPCFSSDAFYKCLHTFLENKTNWCIEFLWNKILGEPKDKIAIIDEVIAIHTRPCFYGDTYWNNNTTFQGAMQEADDLLKKHKINGKRVVYSTVHADVDEFHNRGSDMKFIPNLSWFKPHVSGLRLRGIKQ